QNETAADPTLQVLKQYIQEGWPEHKHQVSVELRPYFDIRNGLDVTDQLYCPNHVNLTPLSAFTSLIGECYVARIYVDVQTMISTTAKCLISALKAYLLQNLAHLRK
ncbi:unnamed protein product, partial [Ixodes persulcatus]